MEITFEADSVSVDSDYRNSSVNVTVEASGREIAGRLDLDDRLYGLDTADIVGEIGAAELLRQIGEEDVRKWLLENSDPDDTLEHIGLDKIHEYLSHGAPDGDSPV
jgi:hypothetical protein